MIDTGTWLLTLATAGVAGVALWAHVPRPIPLNGSQWFAAIFQTLLRGYHDNRGESSEVWGESVRRQLFYSPRSDRSEPLLFEPQLLDCNGDWATRLTGMSLEERADWLFIRDPLGADARYMDPVDLGENVDLIRWFGPGMGWDELAGWGAGDPSFGQRLAGKATWIALGRHDWFDLFEGEFSIHREDSDVLTIKQIISKFSTSDRIIWIAHGGMAEALLYELKEDPELRDRTRAVIFIAGQFMNRDWLEANFNHEVLDTEIRRSTLYATLPIWDSMIMADRERYEAMRLPEPTGQQSYSWIDSVSLPPIAADANPHLVLRAVVTFTAAWCEARSIS